MYAAMSLAKNSAFSHHQGSLNFPSEATTLASRGQAGAGSGYELSRLRSVLSPTQSRALCSGGGRNLTIIFHHININPTVLLLNSSALIPSVPPSTDVPPPAPTTRPTLANCSKQSTSLEFIRSHNDTWQFCKDPTTTTNFSSNVLLPENILRKKNKKCALTECRWVRNTLGRIVVPASGR